MFPMFSLTMALAGLTMLAAPSAHAASFDCAKAKMQDEIAVCSSPALSELDTEMGALWFTYERIPFLMGGSGERKEDAEAFLKKRSSCGADEACLRSAYEERVSKLKQGIGDWLNNVSAENNGEPQWSSAAFPSAVQAIVDGYKNTCTELGGTLKAGFDTPLVMTGDLDGDNVQDFVLNPQNMQCSAAATAFCGNGGCQISLMLSSSNYEKPVDILGGAPSLAQSEEEGTYLDVWVDGTNCNVTNVESSCRARYSWKDGELSTNYEARKYED